MPRSLAVIAFTTLSTLALLLASGPAAADQAQEFDVAKARFDRGLYEEASKLLEVLLDPRKPPCADGLTNGGCSAIDPELVERARGMYVTCLVPLGRYDDADAQIAMILRENPAFSPSPAVFPAEVVDRFTMMRGRMRDELDTLVRERAERERLKREAESQARQAELARLAELQRLAGEETVVERRSRWIAALPMGVGQLQNDDTALAIVFAGAEAVAGITSIVTGVIVADHATVDIKETVLLPDGSRRAVYDDVALNESIAQTTLVNRVAFGTWVGLTVLGIVQAQIAFEPEKITKRPRRERPPSQVTPTLAFDGSGAFVGAAGSF